MSQDGRGVRGRPRQLEQRRRDGDRAQTAAPHPQGAQHAADDEADVEQQAQPASGGLVVDHRVHPLDDVATAWAAAARNDGVRPLVRIA